MKAFMIAVCLVVLVLMLSVTISASLQQNILSATRLLWPDPWFRATLADAYCGFLFFWLWVAWRERSLGRSLLWFVLIMALGNIAMAIYILLRVAALRPGEGVAALLLPRVETEP